MNSIICNKCNLSKDLSNFSKNKSKIKGYNTMCKSCHKLYVKGHYKNNIKTYKEKAKIWSNNYPEKRRKIVLKSQRRIHGNYVSENDFQTMLLSQNNKCAICNSEFLTTRHTNVDHDHATGKIRALLCSGCNKGLGFFKDSIKNCKSAAKYLKKFGGQP
jgi:hypothetical protein